MSKRELTPEYRKELVDSILLNEIAAEPSEAEMDMAWNKVKAVIETRKKSLSPGRFFSNWLPAAGFSLAGIMAIVLIITLGGPSIIGSKRKAGEVYLSRFSSGLLIERNSNKRPVKSNFTIKAGDRIRNESTATALVCADQLFRTALRPGTQVSIKSIKEKGILKSRILLEKGNADFQVKKLQPDESFQIYSGNSVISVVGTVFQVSLTNHTLEVSTKEGEVTVSPDGKGQNILHVPAGKKLILPESGTPKIIPLDKDTSYRLQQFSVSNLSAGPDQTAELVILTGSRQAKVYMNGGYIGSTPAGITINKNESIDLEIAGDNGQVVRMNGLKLQNDRTLSIDLNRPKNNILDLQQSRLNSSAKLGFNSKILSLVSDKSAYIYDTASHNKVKINSKNGWKLAPVNINGRIILVDNKGAAECYQQNGSKIWSLPLPGTLWYGSQIAHNDSLLALSTIDRGIYIFDIQGKLIDHIESDRTGPGYSSPVIDEKGILYYLDESGNMAAYSIQEGRDLWQVKVPSVSAHPLMETTEAIISYYRDDGSIQANAKITGRLLWTISLPEAALKEIFITQYKEKTAVYFNSSSNTGYLRLIDLQKGKIIGNKITGAEINSTALSGSTLWVAESSLILTAFDAASLKPAGILHLGKPAIDLKVDGNSIWVLTEDGLEEIKLK